MIAVLADIHGNRWALEAVAVLSPRDDEWLIESVAVPYDVDAAARAALANGRPDWHHWLRTGRA